MCGVKADAGIGVEYTRDRQPSCLQLSHSRPVQVMLLATAELILYRHSQVTRKREHAGDSSVLSGTAW